MRGKIQTLEQARMAAGVSRETWGRALPQMIELVNASGQEPWYPASWEDAFKQVAGSVLPPVPDLPSPAAATPESEPLYYTKWGARERDVAVDANVIADALELDADHRKRLVMESFWDGPQGTPELTRPVPKQWADTIAEAAGVPVSDVLGGVVLEAEDEPTAASQRKEIAEWLELDTSRPAVQAFLAEEG